MDIRKPNGKIWCYPQIKRFSNETVEKIPSDGNCLNKKLFEEIKKQISLNPDLINDIDERSLFSDFIKFYHNINIGNIENVINDVNLVHHFDARILLIDIFDKIVEYDNKFSTNYLEKIGKNVCNNRLDILGEYVFKNKLDKYHDYIIEKGFHWVLDSNFELPRSFLEKLISKAECTYFSWTIIKNIRNFEDLKISYIENMFRINHPRKKFFSIGVGGGDYEDFVFVTNMIISFIEEKNRMLVDHPRNEEYINIKYSIEKCRYFIEKSIYDFKFGEIGLIERIKMFISFENFNKVGIIFDFQNFIKESFFDGLKNEEYHIFREFFRNYYGIQKLVFVTIYNMDLYGKYFGKFNPLNEVSEKIGGLREKLDKKVEKIINEYLLQNI